MNTLTSHGKCNQRLIYVSIRPVIWCRNHNSVFLSLCSTAHEHFGYFGVRLLACGSSKLLIKKKKAHFFFLRKCWVRGSNTCDLKGRAKRFSVMVTSVTSSSRVGEFHPGFHVSGHMDRNTCDKGHYFTNHRDCTKRGVLLMKSNFMIWKATKNQVVSAAKRGQENQDPSVPDKGNNTIHHS